MGRSRSERRERSGLVINVFSFNAVLGWKIVRQVPVELALEMVALRQWREILYNDGQAVGVQPLRPEEPKTFLQHWIDERKAVTITLPELRRNAGLCGRSCTIGRDEWERLHATRKTRYGRLPVPVEDPIELAIEKVRLWPYPASRVDDGKGAPVYGDRAIRVYPHAPRKRG